MSLINVSASGANLVKTGGCDGCPDAFAVSEQQVASNGTLEFTAAEAGSLRFVGLSSGGAGTAAGEGEAHQDVVGGRRHVGAKRCRLHRTRQRNVLRDVVNAGAAGERRHIEADPGRQPPLSHRHNPSPRDQA
jgi:hypothetical protein